ncbi:MAG: LSM domain-containing protein [Thermoplasmata archaeon]|nr:LSM domain-containing protein [Thermoplasmata archaeon]
MLPTPTQFLERTLPRRATLALKDGRTLTGRLVGLDEQLNLVLDDAEESGGAVARRLGRVVVRGSSVASLVTDDGPGHRSGAPAAP